MIEESLMERAMIKFKTPLNERDLKAALIGLADRERCSVSFTLSKKFDYDPREARRREDLQKSRGTISSLDSNLGFVSLPFDLKVDYFDVKGADQERDESLYTELRFFVAPGYDEGDIEPGELKFMDKVKAYFNSRFGWNEIERPESES